MSVDQPNPAKPPPAKSVDPLSAEEVVERLEKLWPDAQGKHSQPSPELVGHTVGRYSIRQVIGNGAFGVVYLAYDPVMDREVALKIPLPGQLVDRVARSRFLREARAAGLLSHPNIIPVYEAGEAGAFCYIATEYYPAKTLAEWLADRSTAVPFQQAAEIVRQLAEAVEHAHQRGVIHRDLKPGNILLGNTSELDGTELRDSNHSQDQHACPRIIDFGLAYLADENISLTRTGTYLGTTAYMSPEQAEGRGKQVAPSTDIFCLGILLFELLTQVSPFERDSITHTLAAIQQDEPRLKRHRPEVPRNLEAICLRALAKDTTKRYPSAGEFAEDLRRFLRGDPVRARRASPLERTINWVRRYPVLTALISVAMLAAVLVVSLSLRYAFVVSGLSNDLSDALTNAKMQRAEAETARNDAVARGAELRLELYAQNMKSAYDAWHKGWTEEVDRLLTNQFPQLGELDHRGFEWKILQKLIWQEPPIDLPGHEGSVNNVAVFEGGTRLASVGDDSTIRIWNLETQQQEFVMRDTRKAKRLNSNELPDDLVTSTNHSDTIIVSASENDYRAVAASSDGKKLVTGDLVLSLWDLEERRFLRDLAVFPTRIYSAAFSPDGKLVAAHSADQAVQVISLKDGLLRRFQTDYGSYRLGFSPDGKVLAAPYKSPDGYGIRCWDTTTWDRNRDYSGFGHAQSTRGLAFSTDSKFLFTGTWQNDVILVDLTSGMNLLQTPRQRSKVSDVALSPNNQVLAVAHQDGSLIYWKLRDGWQSDPSNALDGSSTLIPAHDGTAHAVRFIGNRLLATCGDDGLVRLWNIQERPNYDRKIDPDVREAIAFMPDGNEILVSTQLGISRYGAKTLELHREVSVWETRSEDPFSWKSDSLAVSHDGHYAAIGGYHGVIVIMDLRTNREAYRIDQTDVRVSRISDIAFSRDGKWLASACRDHTVRIWSTGDWNEIHRINTKGWGSNVEFSPNGHYLAYSDNGGELELLEVSSWRRVARVQARVGTSHGALCFARDGQSLLTGHIDSIIRIWSVPTLAEVGQLKGHSSDITKVAVHPNGKTVASVSHDHTLRLWYLPTRTELGTLYVGTAAGWNCHFSPDGSQLVSIFQMRHDKKENYLLNITAERERPHARRDAYPGI